MTILDRLNLTAPTFRPGLILRAGLSELLIRQAARREYGHLSRLDDAALRDMGLSESDRQSVTIDQIIARMRS